MQFCNKCHGIIHGHDKTYDAKKMYGRLKTKEARLQNDVAIVPGEVIKFTSNSTDTSKKSKDRLCDPAW